MTFCKRLRICNGDQSNAGGQIQGEVVTVIKLCCARDNTLLLHTLGPQVIGKS